MVRHARQAVLHAAELVVRAGVDDSLCGDGRVRVARVAKKRPDERAARARSFRGAAFPQPHMERRFLRDGSAGIGACRNIGSLGGDIAHHRRVYESQPGGGVAARAVSRVGDVRGVFECGDLSSQLKRVSRAASTLTFLHDDTLVRTERHAVRNLLPLTVEVRGQGNPPAKWNVEIHVLLPEIERDEEAPPIMPADI